MACLAPEGDEGMQVKETETPPGRDPTQRGGRYLETVQKPSFVFFSLTRRFLLGLCVVLLPFPWTTSNKIDFGILKRWWKIYKTSKFFLQRFHKMSIEEWSKNLFV